MLVIHGNEHLSAVRCEWGQTHGFAYCQSAFGQLPDSPSVLLGLLDGAVGEEPALVVFDLDIERSHEAADGAREVDDRATESLAEIMHGHPNKIGADLGVLAGQRFRMTIPLNDDSLRLTTLRIQKLHGNQ